MTSTETTLALACSMDSPDSICSYANNLLLRFLICVLWKLVYVQVVIEPSIELQLTMTSLLGKSALVCHPKRVCVANSQETVGNNKTGSTRSQPTHRLLHKHLCPRIHLTRSFLENEIGRVCHKSTGNCYELARSAGGGRIVVGQERVIPIRQ